VIGSQRYLQFPQDFGGFLNPPAEFLHTEKLMIIGMFGENSATSPE